jgi:hypothetical protein
MVFGAIVEVVIAKISSSKGFKRYDAGDLSASYCFIFTNEETGTSNLVFIPHPLISGGYTVAQLEEIESMLIYFDVELLPLDPWMM